MCIRPESGLKPTSGEGNWERCGTRQAQKNNSTFLSDYNNSQQSCEEIIENGFNVVGGRIRLNILQ